LLIIARFTIVLALLPLSAATVTAGGPVNVTQKGRAFSVASVQTTRGEIVRFINDDLFEHQIYVEAPSFTFESDEQEPGSDVEIRFSKAGLFEVRCHIHPKMLLKVEVR